MVMASTTLMLFALSVQCAPLLVQDANDTIVMSARLVALRRGSADYAGAAGTHRTIGFRDPRQARCATAGAQCEAAKERYRSSVQSKNVVSAVGSLKRHGVFAVHGRADLTTLPTC